MDEEDEIASTMRTSVGYHRLVQKWRNVVLRQGEIAILACNVPKKSARALSSVSTEFNSAGHASARKYAVIWYPIFSFLARTSNKDRHRSPRAFESGKKIRSENTVDWFVFFSFFFITSLCGKRSPLLILSSRTFAFLRLHKQLVIPLPWCTMKGQTNRNKRSPQRRREPNRYLSFRVVHQLFANENRIARHPPVQTQMQSRVRRRTSSSFMRYSEVDFSWTRGYVKKVLFYLATVNNKTFIGLQLTSKLRTSTRRCCSCDIASQ